MLGCGSSGGVPLVGPDWGACDPAEPRNIRSRPSILIEKDGFRLLVDTGPDLRTQLLRESVPNVDAVLYTHSHADHVHGIDDLRPFHWRKNGAIDLYMDAETRDTLLRRFDYIIQGLRDLDGLYKPFLTPHLFEPNRPFTVGPFEIQPIRQDHGTCLSNGFRIGDFAYTPDVLTFLPDSYPLLKGVTHWIVDCVREAPHPTHAHLAQAIAWVEEIAPELGILTHMNQSLDYGWLCDRLPKGMVPGHDGLTLTL